MRRKVGSAKNWLSRFNSSLIIISLVKAEKSKSGTSSSSRKKSTADKNASAAGTANAVDTPSQVFDESAVDAVLGNDFLPLDGREDIGDLLEVFDANDSFNDIVVKTETTTKAASKKVGILLLHTLSPIMLIQWFCLTIQRGRNNNKNSAEDAHADEGAPAATNPKKKSKKSTT